MTIGDGQVRVKQGTGYKSLHFYLIGHKIKVLNNFILSFFFFIFFYNTSHLQKSHFLVLYIVNKLEFSTY